MTEGHLVNNGPKMVKKNSHKKVLSVSKSHLLFNIGCYKQIVHFYLGTPISNFIMP